LDVAYIGIDNISSSPPARPKILPFDHIYPPPSQVLKRPPHTAIFYASLTSTNFRELHAYISSLAKRAVPPVEYVFRHIPPPSQGDGSERNYLSGYGVALDLKKMEYLAVDDRYTSKQGWCDWSPPIEIVKSNFVTVADSAEHAATTNEEADSPEIDPIVALLKAYPESETFTDPSMPLTPSDIAGPLLALQFLSPS
jgi:UDP-glucose:glycoprotein glucosyltransferase